MWACTLLEMPDRRRRAWYRYYNRDARARGERVVTYRVWIGVLRQACALARSDPGGDIRL